MPGTLRCRALGAAAAGLPAGVDLGAEVLVVEFLDLAQRVLAERRDRGCGRVLLAWSGLRAPGMTVVTPGCWVTQRSAAWAVVNG